MLDGWASSHLGCRVKVVPLRRDARQRNLSEHCSQVSGGAAAQPGKDWVYNLGRITPARLSWWMAARRTFDQPSPWYAHNPQTSFKWWTKRNPRRPRSLLARHPAALAARRTGRNSGSGRWRSGLLEPTALLTPCRPAHRQSTTCRAATRHSTPSTRASNSPSRHAGVVSNGADAGAAVPWVSIRLSTNR